MEGNLKWCIEQKNRIKLISPSTNLSNEYLINAEETLKVLSTVIKTGSNMWIATQKYYFEYFLAYSILMKFGIKSEIHSCTIQIIKYLEKLKILNINLSSLLLKDKDLRINNQYYLKNIKIEINMIELRNLYLEIKEFISESNKEIIEKVRKEIFN